MFIFSRSDPCEHAQKVTVCEQESITLDQKKSCKQRLHIWYIWLFFYKLCKKEFCIPFILTPAPRTLPPLRSRGWDSLTYSHFLCVRPTILVQHFAAAKSDQLGAYPTGGLLIGGEFLRRKYLSSVERFQLPGRAGCLDPLEAQKFLCVWWIPPKAQDRAAGLQRWITSVASRGC